MSAKFDVTLGGADKKKSLISSFSQISSSIRCFAVAPADTSLLSGTSDTDFWNNLFKAHTEICSWSIPSFNKSGAGCTKKYILPGSDPFSVVDWEQHNWSARLWISNKASLVRCLALRFCLIMTLFIAHLTFDKASTNKVCSLNMSSDSCKKEPQFAWKRLNSPF